MPLLKRFMNVEPAFGRHRRRQRAAAAAAAAASIGHVVALEARLMMHADPNDPAHVDNDIPDDLGVYPVITAKPTNGGGSTTGTGSSSLSAVPLLSSRPGAAAKLYLDFDGDTTSTWGSYSPGTTPAYDTDGDPTTFSDAELANINQIWARVAEKYSPFNIDVTTVNPGTLTNKVSAKVVFGGDGAWLGSQAGGVAYVGGFSNTAPNIAFVFPKNLANGYPQYLGEAAAHESGHMFNLQHQGTWSGTTLTNEYAPANAAGDAPIMGNSYTARRGMWWYGTPSTSYSTMQDDLATISSSLNGFGYRADDFGNDIASSSALTLSGTTINTTAGVITTTGDADVFSFVSGAGAVNLAADVNSVGAMLDLKLTLRDSAGNVLAAADTSTLGESLTADLATSGTYYLTVSSHGGYGDVGQYTVRGSVQPVTLAPLAAPSGLSATAASSTAVDLAWTDNSGPDETGFAIQRSTDNGATWTTIATTAANATSYRDATASASTTYTYRVAAVDATRTSDWSNLAAVTTPAAPILPAAPTSLTARALSSSSVRLTWVDNATNETGFKVYSSRDNRSWTLLGTVGANVTAVDNTGLKRNATYYYRVTAYNAAGESAYSNTASTRTTAVASAALALPGDINLDGAVDFNDLVIFSQNYNQPAANGWADGDLNGDGQVDFNDLVAMSQNYNTALPLAAAPDDGSDTGTLTPVETIDPGITVTLTTTNATTKTTARTPAKPAVNKVFSVKPVGKAVKPSRPLARHA